MPWIGPQCVIVVFPDHTHLLFYETDTYNSFNNIILTIYNFYLLWHRKLVINAALLVSDVRLLFSVAPIMFDSWCFIELV